LQHKIGHQIGQTGFVTASEGRWKRHKSGFEKTGGRVKNDNFPKRIGPVSGPVRFVLVIKNRLLQRNQCPGSRFNNPYRKD
jgi:hypothetical protein